MEENRVAASIKYNAQDGAPRLSAYGKGFVADKILEIAAQAGVPVYREENLAMQLGSLEVGKEIPPELYEVVAEVLSFIYCLDRKKGDEKNGFGQGTG